MTKRAVVWVVFYALATFGWASIVFRVLPLVFHGSQFGLFDACATGGVYAIVAVDVIARAIARYESGQRWPWPVP